MFMFMCLTATLRRDHVLNRASAVVVHALEVRIGIEAVDESCPEALNINSLFPGLVALFAFQPVVLMRCLQNQGAI